MPIKGFQRLKKLKWLTNLYVVMGLFFIVWMFFFDANSALIQWQLQKEIKALEEERAYLKREIEADRALLQKFSDSLEKERYARERYLFKREGEDLYLIEYADSIKQPKF